jgi:hypothetical protein
MERGHHYLLLFLVEIGVLGYAFDVAALRPFAAPLSPVLLLAFLATAYT